MEYHRIAFTLLAMKKISLGLLVIWSLGCFVLPGCQKQVDAAATIEQMMKFCSDLKQISFAGQFNLVGASHFAAFNGLNDLDVDASGKVDLTNANNFKYSANLNVSGKSAEGSTRIGAEVRSLPDYNYFKVTDISVPLGLPFSLAADDKWYKIKKSALAEENTLGGNAKSLNDNEIAKIRNLIASANLFVTTQILPEEVVNNFTSYHFEAKINPAGLGSFLENLTAITHDKTTINIPYLVKLAESSSYDLWITKKNFGLVKLKITSLNNNEADLPNFKLELNLSQFNSPVEVKLPAAVTSDFSLEKFFGISLNNL